jgi:hypothetical protein
MPECPLPLTVQESPGRVRLGSLAYGEEPTLKDARRRPGPAPAHYVTASRATGIQRSRELAPPDLATMDFLHELGELAAAGGAAPHGRILLRFAA